MRRASTVTILLTLSGVSLTACGDNHAVVHSDFPRLAVSTTMVELGSVELGTSSARTLWLSNLGDLTMGIRAIELGKGDRSTPHFSANWSLDALQCPEGVEVEQPEPVAADTGLEAEASILVLGPGCRLPVEIGFAPEEAVELWGSLIVHTDTEPLEDDEGDPSYHADPLHSKRIVYLTGQGWQGRADMRVEPRHHDYGRLWEGSSETATIAIHNVGDAPLTVQEPRLQDCDEGFTISATGLEGAPATLEPGISSYVTVTFTPDSTAPATCSLLVESDDADTPLVEIELEANTGMDADNAPPTAVIRSPSPGHRWEGGEADSLALQINIFDLDQPADTLTCRVKSMVQAAGASVAHCEADDASGMVWVDVPYEYVDVGIDTLRVQVADASGVISHASTTVLWNAAYPFSDDDGDGWGGLDDIDEDGHYDCDDLDVNTYPYAAELPDGRDNDCDGVTDEGTVIYDDDGDSFSEQQGDCNDHDEEVFAGNVERADGKDNDCDGVVDEGTSLFDDDGDGYSEMDGDCDDSDPEVHPGAVEYNDGIDNDCDGLRDHDDDCVALDHEPYVVGGIVMEWRACEPGESIQVSVYIHDPDGQPLDYAWSGEEGLIIEPLTGSPSVTVTCPEPDPPGGHIYNLHVMATDADDNPVWVFDEVRVYPEGELHRQHVETVVEE